jgi:hypothetical protein
MRKAKAFAPAPMMGWQSAILRNMLTYLRYALATFCFAASVGCLALWGRTLVSPLTFEANYLSIHWELRCTALRGMGNATYSPINPERVSRDMQFRVVGRQMWFGNVIRQQGVFGQYFRSVFFPLWYPALILALAGVAALRVGRRFTLRSAIIAMTVVAGLLGLAAAL